MSYVVSESQPPQLASGVAYWERSSDPWHPEAFAGLNLEQATVVAIGGEIKDAGSPRSSGWMAIDWIENPVGFVADGSEQEGDTGQYVFKTGPAGHMCAYPVAEEERGEA